MTILAERHIESVSRWSDESADEFSQPILQIGHHHQQNRDVRVRFANEHELNDNNQKNQLQPSKGDVFVSMFYFCAFQVNKLHKIQFSTIFV